jgi:hypothetical protein
MTFPPLQCFPTPTPCMTSFTFLGFTPFLWPANFSFQPSTTSDRMLAILQALFLISDVWLLSALLLLHNLLAESSACAAVALFKYVCLIRYCSNTEGKKNDFLIRKMQHTMGCWQTHIHSVSWRRGEEGNSVSTLKTQQSKPVMSLK